MGISISKPRFFLSLLMLLIATGSMVSFRYYPPRITRMYDQTTITEDGVEIYFDVFTPRTIPDSSKLPGIILGHGVMVNKEVFHLMALQLAENGFIVVTLDFRGHGRSGGELNGMQAMSSNSTLVNDVSAIKSYLATRGDVNMSNLGYVGYSMGGVPGFELLSKDNDFHAMVGIAPVPNYQLTNLTNPQNLLMIIGENDEAITMNDVWLVMENKTGLSQDMIEIGKVYGDFSLGTAAKLYIEPNQEHFFAPYDYEIIQQTCAWFGQALLPKEDVEASRFLYLISLSTVLLAMITAIIGIIMMMGVLIPPKLKNGAQQQNSRPENAEKNWKLDEPFLQKQYWGFGLLLSYPFMLSGIILAVTPFIFAAVFFGLFLGPSLVLYFLLNRFGKFQDPVFRMKSYISEAFHKLGGETPVYGLLMGFALYLSLHLTIGSLLGIFPSDQKWGWSVVFYLVMILGLINYTSFWTMLYRRFTPLKRMGIMFSMMTGLYVVLLLIPCIIIQNYFLMVFLIPLVPLFLIIAAVSVRITVKTNNALLAAMIVGVMMTMVLLTFSPTFSF